MQDPNWIPQQATLTLQRLLPRLRADYRRAPAAAWEAFTRRLDTHFPRLFALLYEVYGTRYDFIYHLEALLRVMADSWLARPADLRALDEQREAEPTWFHDQQMLGGVCYVDLFAGDLKGVRRQLPYFKELGLTYLHLMPLFKAPEGNSDGGYAVSSYREVEPKLGTMTGLRALARDLRAAGISLAVDFVFNHTSDEHEWAQKALAGDPEYRDFYYFFPNRQMPDAYEKTLREIFPDEHPGAFSWHESSRQWVWTTFHTFQWDLNYSNPAVFAAMAGELLFLANQGVEVLRLDAVAFIWKQLGTVCENLPQAHTLIQAFNAVTRIAAPSLIFKSEAIVHPDDVVKYIRPDECQISYNPLLMALLWNSLATRKIRLLRHSMRSRFAIHPACAWVNYVRVHDDIGWTFSDEDAAVLGINGNDHRRFLNQFFTDRFPGSFASGLPFQENPKTGDCRISGTGASLAGLEKALAAVAAGAPDGEAQREHAIRRILMIHGIILSIGGIPLIYLGDEIGTLNDYSFHDDPAKAEDSRWVHRPVTDWAKMALRNDPTTVEGRIYAQLAHMIAQRKTHPVFAGGEMRVLETASDHVFAFARSRASEGGAPNARLIVLANFSEYPQPANLAPTRGVPFGRSALDLISGVERLLTPDIVLEPLQLMWLLVG